MKNIGTEQEPILKLKSEHLIGLENTTVYYKGISNKLNMFWVSEYVEQHNLKLKKVK